MNNKLVFCRRRGNGNDIWPLKIQNTQKTSVMRQHLETHSVRDRRSARGLTLIKTLSLLSLNLVQGLAVPLPNSYAPGELLLKWKDGPASPAAVAGNRQIGSTLKANFNTLGWQHLTLPSGMTVRESL